MQKAQAAMEFLMTYGWAILVVLIVTGALAYFGVLTPSNFSPERCVLGTGLKCADFVMFDTTLMMKLESTIGRDMTIKNIQLESTELAGGACSQSMSAVLKPMASMDVSIPSCSFTSTGKKKAKVVVNYTFSTSIEHTIVGEVVVKISRVSGGGGPPADSCSDPDASDYYTLGTASGTVGGVAFSNPDYCNDTIKLNESTCSGVSPSFIIYSCPSGCLNGKCNGGTPDSCTDTDAGQDYYHAGTVSGYAGGSSYSYTDSCAGSTLTEYNCTGTISEFTIYACQSGCTVNECNKVLLFNPTQDARISLSAPATSFPTSVILPVRNVQNTLLKFSLSGIDSPVASAKLRLYLVEFQVASYPSDFYATIDNGWVDSGGSAVTWNSAPVGLLPIIGSIPQGSYVAGTWMEANIITSVVQNGILSIRANSSSGSWVNYSSKEGVNSPQLVVTLS